MEILEHIKEFKRKLIAQGFDFKTAKNYGCHLILFFDALKNLYNSPLHITTRDIEDYIIWMEEDNYSDSHINQFIASVKRFYFIAGQTQKCSKLVYRRNEPKVPNILTYPEIRSMLEAKIYLKHRTILHLLYDGALRISELINLKIEHISKDRRITIVASKFGKSRVITISQSTLDLLRQYYKEFKPIIYLFNGEGEKAQYSAGSIRNIVKDTARKAGIQKRVYPHLLRASRATHLLDNGASDMYVSAFLGHAKIQTTKDYYTRLTLNAMQKMFDRIDEHLRVA